MTLASAIIPRSDLAANPAPTTARCTVGLLTWNAGDDGIRCLDALAQQTEPRVELLWVDNASRDGTPERLPQRFPWLPAPHVNPTNLGFCAGHNAMLARCATPYYLALNQDAVLEPDYIARLCDWMDGEPRLAMASGLLLNPEPSSAPAGGAARVQSASMTLGRNGYPFKCGYGLPLEHPAVAELRARRFVPMVEGSAMLLRMDACRAVSPAPDAILPPEFFAYFEDADLAIRLYRAGWLCGTEGAARAQHAGQGTQRRRPDFIEAQFIANHWLIALRHVSAAALLAELPWRVAGELRHWLPRYLRQPAAFKVAVSKLVAEAARARRHFAQFDPPTAVGGSPHHWGDFDRFSRAEMALHHRLVRAVRDRPQNR